METKRMIKLKSLNEISEQRDRLKIINRNNMNANKNIQNRADLINKCASNCRIIRGLSIFEKDKSIKKQSIKKKININFKNDYYINYLSSKV